MRTLDRVRDLFNDGDEIECVENTYKPQENGSRRKLLKVGRSVIECKRVGKDGVYWMYLPKRAGDVVSVDDREVTYLLDSKVERLKGHTITLRRVGGAS